MKEKWLKIRNHFFGKFITFINHIRLARNIIFSLPTGGISTFEYRYLDKSFLFSHRGENIEILNNLVSHILTQNLAKNKAPYDFSHIPFSKGDIIIDIGAHVGTTSIFLAKTNPDSKIYAFEPSSSLFQILENNIRLNEITNIIAINRALNKDNLPVKLVIPFELAYSASMVESFRETNKQRTYAKTKNLSGMPVRVEWAESLVLADFLAENKIYKIKLFKIDCEGAEYDILYSLPDNIWKNIEYLVMETHGKDESQLDLIKYVKSKLSKGAWYAVETLTKDKKMISWEQV